jgi:hypothetical protein
MWVSKDLTKHHRWLATTAQGNPEARAVEVASAIPTTCRAIGPPARRAIDR